MTDTDKTKREQLHNALALYHQMLQSLRTAPDRRRDDLSCFLVAADGIRFHVAAYTKDHAVSVVLCSEMENIGWNEQAHDNLLAAECVELEPGDMESVQIHGYEADGGYCYLDEAFERFVLPGIVACNRF